MAPAKKKNNKNKSAKTKNVNVKGNTNPQKAQKKSEGNAPNTTTGTTKKKKLRKKPSCWDPFPLYAYEVKDVTLINKNILFSITCLFVFVSLIIIWLGSYLLEEREVHQEAISDNSLSKHSLNISLILICSGFVSLCIALCGCIGVFRENIILIRVFYISLIIALVLKFTGATFFFVLADYSRPFLEKIFADGTIVDYRTSKNVESFMDSLQLSFYCCGIRDDGFKDWSRSVYFNCSETNPSPERCGVPWSCCRNNTGIENAYCGKDVQELDRNIASRRIYTKGCLLALQNFVYDHAIVIGILFLLEMMAMTVVIFQCTHLVNEIQMLTGVYIGPWWENIGKKRPKPQAIQPQPQPPEAAAPPKLSTSPPAAKPAALVEPTEKPPIPPSVIQMGRGPAVRRKARSSAPNRFSTHNKAQQVDDNNEKVNEDKMFSTSFKGALAGANETELYELTCATSAVLSGAADVSYFCHKEGSKAKSISTPEGFENV